MELAPASPTKKWFTRVYGIWYVGLEVGRKVFVAHIFSVEPVNDFVVLNVACYAILIAEIAFSQILLHPSINLNHINVPSGLSSEAGENPKQNASNPGNLSRIQLQDWWNKLRLTWEACLISKSCLHRSKLKTQMRTDENFAQSKFNCVISEMHWMSNVKIASSTWMITRQALII